MASELTSRFTYELMSGCGQIFSIFVTLLWIMVACGTVRKLTTGNLLFAPCLKDLEGIEQEQAKKHFGEKAV